MILDVRCRYLSLFMLYINIEIGKLDVLKLDQPVTTVWELAVHLAIAGHVVDGVFLCCSFFSTRCLG